MELFKSWCILRILKVLCWHWACNYSFLAKMLTCWCNVDNILYLIHLYDSLGRFHFKLEINKCDTMTWSIKLIWEIISPRNVDVRLYRYTGTTSCVNLIILRSILTEKLQWVSILYWIIWQSTLIKGLGMAIRSLEKNHCMLLFQVSAY